MRKRVLFSAIVLLVAGITTISCSKNTNQAEPEQTNKGLKVCIPSSFSTPKTMAVADGGISTFSTSENVWIFNKFYSALEANPLHPDANASTANLVGVITGSYFSGNSLTLMYNSTQDGIVDYTSQDGTIDNVVDAAEASVSVSAKTDETITISNASFINLQSIFKFTFKNSGTVLNVKSVHIVSGGNKLVQSHKIYNNTETYGPITVYNTTAQSSVYVALRFTATANDPIHFIVMDEDGNLYSATKNAPASGFATNKFYTSTINVTPGLRDGFDRFTVNQSSNSIVYFSPGNLVYDGSDYTFETVPFNTSKGSLGYNSWLTASSPRGYFNWNNIASDNETPISFNIYSKNWRIMTETEWNGVLGFGIGSYRTMTNSGVARYYNVKDLNNNYGLLLPPDGATVSDVSGLTSGELTSNVDYNIYVARGFVFLPCAGSYNGSSWGDAGKWGSYLSSSRLSEGTSFKRLHIFSTGINILNTTISGRWDSARLVHE